MPLSVRRLLSLWPTLALASCVGDIALSPGPETGRDPEPKTDTTRPGPTPTAPPATDPPPPPAACKEPKIGPTPLRRLSRREYNNTVAELLGDNSRPGNTLPVDGVQHGFDNNAYLLEVSPAMSDAYARLARELAAKTVATGLPRLLPCEPATADDACARRFVEAYGKRAFRRPLTTAEGDRLFALYQTGKRLRGTVDNGVRLVVEATLLSPSFLYRAEIDRPAEGDVAALSPYEIASRLSYLFWASMPDAELFAAADSGRLNQPDEIVRQAKRLLGDPRAAEAVLDFQRQWLLLTDLDETTKDKVAYPEFTPALRGHMKRETETFIRHVVLEGDGRLDTLLTGGFSFVNKPLAAFYGVSGPADAATFARTSMDPVRRPGVLAHASVMTAQAGADHSDPVLRGKLVRERLLCHELPSPPADVVAVPPEQKPGVSTRESFASHLESEQCRVCHRLMNPIGLPSSTTMAWAAGATRTRASPWTTAASSWPRATSTAR